MGDEIERSHRLLLLHRIDEPGAVDEVRLAALDHRMMFRQRLRRHGEVGIEDRQHVVLCRGEAFFGIGLTESAAAPGNFQRLRLSGDIRIE